jgi:hypothetical protein
MKARLPGHLVFFLAPNQPLTPDWLGEHLTFDDANLGPMLCLRNWHHDGPWIFAHNGTDWYSLRRANQRDCAVLGVSHWMQVEPAGQEPFSGTGPFVESENSP